MLRTSLLLRFAGAPIVSSTRGALLSVSRPSRGPTTPFSSTPAPYSAISRASTVSSSQTGTAGSESISDKIYRWLDITGFLTRWNNRKEWLLDLPPFSRQGTPLVTEFERKQEMFVSLNAFVISIFALYLGVKGMSHLSYKGPTPSYEGFPGVDGRKKDFTMMSRLWFIEPKERCKECRWLDLECKKECFASLKAEGHTLKVNGGNPLSVPRGKLEPPHFH
ncbi:hypothetical protein TGPRC2_264040 [Toxoplasma gondii TgCatPRC2]|uniref:Uncharacterized protein n=3 Tax=Toxoplasma gondii TaxID=5811 RepID=A0A151HNF5_TOXGO|nr:hypothetical protein TGME49_264040 [Toxoplasma gondii ME49]EPT29793.1 hypothetical protein TGME49_264040 [Toxoplasma gondii ME49]KYF40852.1 hypothetical protein TGARI_264040 [Toxoplasma gondii ARI]KYK70791.1 hypothetical protein TGPRC2_264040 [Toxoplasma gondii TgCatPRC2]|eukprot:XP_002365494.1 hypothetical protein TGME49_264040 [Toxoplasma gondii ME49]